MQSDGPYKVERHALGGVGIVGPSRDGSYTGLDMSQSEERVGYLNEGYAEGRKAAEPGPDPSGVSLQNFMGGAK